MTFKKVQDMRIERSKLTKEARGILELETTEKRSLATDEVEHYERIMKEVDGLGVRIEREERLAGIEDTFTGNRQADGGEQPGGTTGERTNPRATEEYRDSFWNVLRSARGMADPQEIRDLFKADDAKGGYLAPEEFETTFLRDLSKVSIMRQMATSMQSSTDRRIPMVAEKPSFSYIDEKGTYGKTSMKFAVQNMGSHKAGGIILVSEELMTDSYFNLAAEINSQFLEAQSVLEEASFIIGDGVDKPTGFLVNAQKGVDAAPTGLTADDLLDLMYGLKRGYRQNAAWLMNDTSIKAVRKLKDGNGQYIWQPGMLADEPDKIFGKSLATSDSMPEIEAGSKSVAFGDFKQYRIMDRLGIAIQRLDELYAETGQIGFRCSFRHDGKLLVPEAIKFIEHGA